MAWRQCQGELTTTVDNSLTRTILLLLSWIYYSWMIRRYSTYSWFKFYICNKGLTFVIRCTNRLHKSSKLSHRIKSRCAPSNLGCNLSASAPGQVRPGSGTPTHARKNGCVRACSPKGREGTSQTLHSSTFNLQQQQNPLSFYPQGNAMTDTTPHSFYSITINNWYLLRSL